MRDFQPRFFKYKKYHNCMIVHKLKKKEFKHFKLNSGFMGLKAVSSYIINGAQISACIRSITRDTKRTYKIRLYCFPNISITSKSISVRMGKGVGSIKSWIFVIKKNQIFLELFGKYKYIVFNSLKNCKKKLPFPTKIITKDYKNKWKAFKICDI